MTCPARQAKPHHPRAAFWMVAAAFAVTMLGTILPTPLYPLYRSAIGFSELMVTVIYATYAVGVIGALLAFGSWSDQLGRRRVLGAGLALSAASAIVFLTRGGLPALFTGRLLSGLSAGLFTGAGTVAVIELAPASRREFATLVATGANVCGLGCGPLLSGFLAQYAPWPLRLCYIADLVLVALGAGAVARAPETVDVPARPRLHAQRLALPAQVRGVFVPAAIANFAGFAVSGFFTAVAPDVLGHLLHIHNHAVTALVVFALFFASPFGQVAESLTNHPRGLRIGCAVLVGGAALVGLAVALANFAILLLAAIATGFAQGMVFRAGMAGITAASPDSQRAEVTSTFFVISYVGISIPVIGLGVANRLFGLQLAGIGFAAGAALLALAALAWLLRKARAAST